MLMKEMYERLSLNGKFSSLPEHEKEMLIRKAVFIGEELADRVSFRFKTSDVNKMVSEVNITVERSGKGRIGSLSIYSTYDHKAKKITLFMDAINDFGPGKENYFIGHELFHYYEKELKIKQRFDDLNEISAHHFSSALLNM